MAKPNPFTAKAKKATPKETPNGKTKVNRFTAKAKESVEPKRTNAFTAKAARKSNPKLDFARNGIKYHNVRQHGSYWRVDVTTGDRTETFNNRFGSWMMEVEGSEVMKDGRTFEIAAGCRDRWEEELKSRGIPTPAQRRIAREAEEAKTRRGRKKAIEEAEDEA